MRRPLAVWFLLQASASGQQPVAPPWCGAVTPDSVVVTVPLDQAGVTTRLAVSTAANLSFPVFSDPAVSQSSKGNAVRLSIGGLVPETDYFYTVEVNGSLLPAAGGRFRTFPSPGPASFRFAFSACSDWEESDQDVFAAILLEEPRFFIHMGDLHYQDTDTDDPAPYRSHYTDALTEAPEMGGLFRQVPTSYIWDDHDYAGNDSDRTNDGRAALRRVYRERVPHYPLPAGGPDAAIHQAFTCGRVRFILSDLRSERDPDAAEDDAEKSMMGTAQKQWFKAQLVAARDDECPLIVWMSGVPLLSESDDRDHWGSYQTERTELLEFLRDEKIQNLIVISGDMHALAFDDGRTTEDYVPGVRVPVFHAAALARPGSIKGGPYSGGTSAGDGRYGIFDIGDDGTSVSATYRGRIVSSATSVTTWKSHTHHAEPVRPRTAKNLTARPVLNAIQLEWTDDSGVESGYRIERRNGGAAWTTVALLGAGATAHADTTAQPAKGYDYRVVALNGAIEAAPSVIAPVTSLSLYQNWKLLHFGDAHAPDHADGDHDGHDATAEFLFGTDPAKSDRFPWSAVRQTDGQVTVSHPTLAGRIYQIEFSDHLASWQAGPPPVDGDGAPRQWTDDGRMTGGLPGKRYYRVKVIMAQ